MSLATWFTVPQLHRASVRNNSGRQRHRQPTHSRPSLEHLEERTLLDASSGLISGATGNLNLNNNFNLASNGIVLPTVASTPGTTAVTPNVFPTAGGATALAVTSTFVAQDQNSSQFRDFAVNSEGPNSQIDLNTEVGMATGAFGFGSGTQPNAPWKPNAYNLGLANGQFGYSTQTDMGFSAGAAPSVRRGVNLAARSLPRDPNPARNRDQDPPLNQDEESAEMPEQLAPKRNLREQEQAPQNQKDKDIGDTKEDFRAITEQRESEKQSPLETVMQEDGSLPDSLWLSALAPAPMAGLIAGLPGMAAAAEGCEAGAEAAE